jgi:hypothetical protein
VTKEGKFFIVDSREPTSMLSMDWSKYKLIFFQKNTAILESVIREVLRKGKVQNILYIGGQLY